MGEITLLNASQITVLLGSNRAEKGVYMGNETFFDLKSSAEIKKEHIGVAYAYLYLTMWAYRYCKHIATGFQLDNSLIKQILGYSSRNQTFNYLIKKNGALDQIGYTETTRDIPVSWKLQEDIYGDMRLSFTMLSSLDSSELPVMHSRYFIKKPLQLFHRVQKNEQMDNMPDERDPKNQNSNPTNQDPINQKAFSVKQNLINQKAYFTKGIAYNLKNTHFIPFDVFVFCMSHEEIGCIGFYLYSYIKHMNDRYESGYDVSLESLAEKTGINRRTLVRYMDGLKSYSLISVQLNQDFYVPNRKKEDRKSNTYHTNERFQFHSQRQPYPKMKSKSEEKYIEYLEIKKRIEEEYQF